MNPRGLVRLLMVAGIVLALGVAGVVPVACNNSKSSATAPSQPTSDPVRRSEPGSFTDMTAASGIDFTYRNGEEADQLTILETLGGGVALFDYDRDGMIDLFATGGGYCEGPATKQIQGYPSRLYKNLGGWHFRDVTKEVGLDQPQFYTHGCAVADFDNDGWPDLLVTGYGRLVLYRNREGKRFEDMTEAAGMKDNRELHWSTSAAWGDFNGDGHPDVFIAHYVDWSFRNHPTCQGAGPKGLDVCTPKAFNPLPQQLYLNNGNGTFRDASRDAHLKPAKGLGVLAVDIDQDGKLDVYLVNDTMEKHLYWNRGGGRFDEVGRARAAALTEMGGGTGSMGVDAADYDGSGHFSLWVTNYQQESHDLYRNQGAGWFQHMSRRAGITAIGLDFVGFGTGFIDYDLDGAEDIFISNGHVMRYPAAPSKLAQRAVLLHNLRRPGQPPAEVRFQEVSEQGGPYFHGVHRGRGAAFGDLDNDGRIDIVLSHCNEPVALLRNTHDSGNHWLGFRLIGQPNRDAVGAQLTLEVEGQRLIRYVKGGGSYLSASDPRALFGLGRVTKVDRLTVRWPSGKQQSWTGESLGVDRYLVLREGERSVELPPAGGRRPEPAEAGTPA